MGGNGNHGLNPKTRILIETWILDAFKFFKKNNLDRIGVIEIQRYIEEYGVVPLKLTDMKYRKGNLSIGTRRLAHFLIILAKMNKVIHIPNTTFWKRINEEQDAEEAYVPKPKYCNKCNILLTKKNKVGWKQRSLLCKPCFLKKRREYTHLPHIKERAREHNQLPEVKKQNREYSQRPKVKKRIRNYRQRPEVKERVRKYNQCPEVKERRKEYTQRPEVKEHAKEHKREYGQRPEVKEHRREQKREYHQRPKVRERCRENLRKWRETHKKQVTVIGV